MGSKIHQYTMLGSMWSRWGGGPDSLARQLQVVRLRSSSSQLFIGCHPISRRIQPMPCDQLLSPELELGESEAVNISCLLLERYLSPPDEWIDMK